MINFRKIDAKFQSPDGDFVYSDNPHHERVSISHDEFQSPDGDFVYSDVREKPYGAGNIICFNPLTGISSILTRSPTPVRWRGSVLFQSPDGDFVYSDGRARSVPAAMKCHVSIP